MCFWFLQRPAASASPEVGGLAGFLIQINMDVVLLPLGSVNVHRLGLTTSILFTSTREIRSYDATFRK